MAAHGGKLPDFMKSASAVTVHVRGGKKEITAQRKKFLQISVKL